MPALLLGSFAFRDFEIPEHISGIGGKQAIHKHELIGSGIVLDAMGPRPHDLKWSGLFRGAGSDGRARALDALRVSGAMVPLSWRSFYYLVIVEDFEAKQGYGFEMSYSITCKVVGEPFAAASVAVSTLNTLIGADMGALATIVGAL